jgi:hypothetical protein
MSVHILAMQRAAFGSDQRRVESMNCPRSLLSTLMLAVIAVILLPCDSVQAQSACYSNPGTASCCTLGIARFTDLSTLDWDPPNALCPQSPIYDVVKGDIGTLHSSQDVSQAVITCFENGTALLTATDTDVPPVGTGYWYLVRVEDPSQSLGGPASTTWNSPQAPTVQTFNGSTFDDDELDKNPPSACFP